MFIFEFIYGILLIQNKTKKPLLKNILSFILEKFLYTKRNFLGSV